MLIGAEGEPEIVGVQVGSFRGLSELWLDWHRRATIFGGNGSGKTRLLEAFAWLMGSPQTLRMLRSQPLSAPLELSLSVIVREFFDTLPVFPAFARTLGVSAGRPDLSADAKWWDAYGHEGAENWQDVLSRGIPEQLLIAARAGWERPLVRYSLRKISDGRRTYDRTLVMPRLSVRTLRSELRDEMLPQVWEPLSEAFRSMSRKGEPYVSVAVLPEREAPPISLQWLPSERSWSEAADDLAAAYAESIAAVSEGAASFDELLVELGLSATDDDGVALTIDPTWWATAQGASDANILLEQILPNLTVYGCDLGALAIRAAHADIQPHDDSGFATLSAGERRWINEACATAAEGIRSLAERLTQIWSLTVGVPYEEVLDDLGDEWDDVQAAVESNGFWEIDELQRLLRAIEKGASRAFVERDALPPETRWWLDHATRVRRRPRARVWLLDEPEAHLHPLLQGRVLRGIQTSPADVVVASHQPRFINRPGWTTHLLRRDAERHRLTRTDGEHVAAIEQFAMGLGLTSGELVVNLRGILFVEGEHEVTILQDQFGSDFALAAVKILRLHGTDNLGGIVHQELLTSLLTDLPVAIMIDNVHLSANGEPRQTTDEGRKLRHFLSDLGNSGRRPHLAPLSRPDIIAYLNEDLIRATNPSFPGWEAVLADFRAEGATNFKQWLKRSCNVRLSNTFEIQETLTLMRQARRPLEPELIRTVYEVLAYLSAEDSS